ncbi:hypothetical protein K504DRAFT_453095 [Pleomassaria siparia CBS 279.74]|uniref:Uncharacterized protein n=1 Tax=Pleomassaria siparia CBS 279.74 TaxID=1314801 RepID=A0A6G1JPR8_9PLEO|nr:hypothetical protein K504DRAFT_453095 [Pleomassaria siparia CBS 279.74]
MPVTRISQRKRHAPAPFKAKSLFVPEEADNKNNARVINAEDLNLEVNNIDSDEELLGLAGAAGKVIKEEEEEEELELELNIQDSRAKQLAKTLKLRILLPPRNKPNKLAVDV